MDKKVKHQYFGINLIKVLASLFVPLVHAFVYSNFYNENIAGEKMFLLIFIREILLCCVPLFIMTTGYLKTNAEINKEHYKKLKPILVSYILISIITIFFRKLYLTPNMSILGLVLGVFNFSAIEYAWYVEMYIGLFLLIPFLNILYRNIKTKKQKQILLITLFFLCSIAPTLAMLRINNISLDIFPDWWRQLYPVLYYYIGCYIKEYQPKISKLKNIMLLILSVFITTILTFSYYHGTTLTLKGILEYYASQTVVITTFIFLLIYNININNEFIKRVTSTIASLTLNIYLFTYIFERIYPKKMASLLNGPNKSYVAIFIIAPLIFISCLGCSYILNGIIDLSKKVKMFLRKSHSK